MKKAIIIAAFVGLAALAACSAPDRARRVLENNGYTDVQVTGHAWFACADSDTFSTAFSATAPGGHHVTGAVCMGLLKGSTIRFY